MRNYNRFNSLFDQLLAAYYANKKKYFVILVGGCSRAGKSTFTELLVQHFHQLDVRAVHLGLDSWLLSVEKRKIESTVLERYEMERVRASIDELLAGKMIYPPVYDPSTRKRIKQESDRPIELADGSVLIVEGVIALADVSLLGMANVRIFVQTTDFLRIKRLLHFYRDIKKINKDVYKEIILKREKEEVSYIKQTSIKADFIFDFSTLLTK